MIIHLIEHLHWPVITVWKIIGFLGVTVFAGRWLEQMIASRRAGKPVITRLFWILSLLGSSLCLIYFTFGKNDSVGIISYLFPSIISVYNLVLDMRYRHRLHELDARRDELTH